MSFDFMFRQFLRIRKLKVEKSDAMKIFEFEYEGSPYEQASAQKALEYAWNHCLCNDCLESA